MATKDFQDFCCSWKFIIGKGRNPGNFWLAFWAKWWPHKFILNLTDLYKSQTNLIFWHSLLNLKITFKSQNLYHFKTPPPLLSMPLVARERKVSFSPHKSHLESFFFSESVFPSNSIMGLLWCYKIDFPGLVIKKVVKSMCHF